MPEVLPAPNDVDATEMRELELEPDNTEPATEALPAVNVIEVLDTIKVEMA